MNNEKINPAIQLTEACNKNCSACLRPPSAKAKKWSYQDFLAYLDDLQTITGTNEIAYQFVTGGEPTIWRDEGRDIVDVLAALSRVGIIKNLTMPTNGRVFENKEKGAKLLTKLSEETARMVIVGLSVAKFQTNLTEDGCVALSNLLELCEELSPKVFPVALVTLYVDDDASKRLSQKHQNLYQRVTALAPLGAAADQQDQCPSLSFVGNDKSPLGAFQPHLEADARKKLGLSGQQFVQTPNAELMDRLSHFNNCGRSPFVDEKWHYCLPLRDWRAFDLCRVGDMRPDTLNGFIDRTPLVQSFREDGLISTVNRLKGRLSQPARDQVEMMFGPDERVSVAYRGCMICKALHDRGVFEELVAVA